MARPFRRNLSQDKCTCSTFYELFIVFARQSRSGGELHVVINFTFFLKEWSGGMTPFEKSVLGGSRRSGVSGSRSGGSSSRSGGGSSRNGGSSSRNGGKQ